MARDMGEPGRGFNPCADSAAPAAALPAADPRGADLADIAEQVLEEAALAAERRRLVAFRADPRDLLEPAALGGDHVAGGVEAYRQHGVLGDARGGERALAGGAGDVVPHRLAELALEARLTERALDGIAVVDAGLDRLEDHLVGKVALVVDDRAAARHQHGRAEHNTDAQNSRHSSTSPPWRLYPARALGPARIAGNGSCWPG